jgi:hypothetical protein
LDAGIAEVRVLRYKNHMNPVETYLRELRDIRSTGAAVPETSYYGPLANLLNEIGKTLKPKVRCVINLANRGAGIPDGGLFTAEQVRKNDPNPIAGQIPARGAIEAKPTAGNVAAIAKSKQVAKYCREYGLVLVTNFREFMMVSQDGQGQPAALECYQLADSDEAFWQAAAHPRKFTEAHGERFTGYLLRAMQHNAALTDPKDLAWFLASYARDARLRVESADLPALASIREALQEALGMKFTGDDGEHFFRSTLVQTIFYGVFSAWVLWHRENPNRTDSFDWRMAEWSLHVPFIRALYEEVATPSKLGPLGLVEVLDWTAAALSRVNRGAFFERFQDEHAVQYFYEPFLEAFDPQLRKQLGVWYTPPEIVRYQVARVDTVLREELNVADGLADPNVVVLDPCCGTGAYLVEVLDHIANTLKAKGGDDLLAADLKQAAMSRVFGFEILPAPFVVAHLQLGLMLQKLGVPLSNAKLERVGVYLTNSLTGWEPPKEPKKLLFPELQAERDAAEKVKRDARILVVLGNPPYNGFAGVAVDEEARLIEPYKEGLADWGITKNYLDDLYVRFFRLAERRIAEMTGKGVVSFISNFSYLAEPSFVAVRQRFLGEFDKLWFDCMNGDSRETGKVTPDGKPDPSVFSTEYNRQGIRVGTAVCVIVRREERLKEPVVRFRHFWGASKRRDLLASLEARELDSSYEKANPNHDNRFSFRPQTEAKGYMSWPSLPELAAMPPMLGLNDNRRQAVHAFDRDEIVKRMKAYFDPKVPFEKLTDMHPGLTTDAARFDAAGTREELLRTASYDNGKVQLFFFRPFDRRWAYIETRGKLWNEVRPQLVSQMLPDGEFLVARCHAPKAKDGASLYHGRHLGDQHVMHKDAYFLPFQVTPTPSRKQAGLFDGGADDADGPRANLSAAAREYLASLGLGDPDADRDVAALIWLHALAIGYSPAYIEENADGIRRDWPRIPLPADAEALHASANLGRRLADLLDCERPVAGVTAGDVAALFQMVGVVTGVGGPLDADAGDLAVTAGWGYEGSGGATMPGRGKVVTRKYSQAELDAIATAADAHGMTAVQMTDLLGRDTRDVYLSDRAYWKNVPANIWDYFIGGYQVIKKWLSYREQPILGRPLRIDEARHATDTARRIAAILLMQPALDENYRAAKGSAV